MITFGFIDRNGVFGAHNSTPQQVKTMLSMHMYTLFLFYHYLKAEVFSFKIDTLFVPIACELAHKLHHTICGKVRC